MLRLERIYTKFQRDDIFTRSSSLAYYSSLAIAPLIILAMTFLGLIDLDMQQSLVREANLLIGSDAGVLLETIIQNSKTETTLVRTSNLISVAFLLLSASIIFRELQATLNIIFGINTGEPKKSTIIATIKEVLFQRLLSIAMVVTFIFITIISLIVSSSLSFIISDSPSLAIALVKFIIDLLIFCLLFTIIIKILPEKRISIKKSFYAGGIISVLFILGKELISIYIRNVATLSSYGAAGSLVVLLIWLYYSSIIFFIGAELAHQFVLERK